MLLVVSAAVQQLMPRRPGASLVNPNKAGHMVTVVEFASDRDDSQRSFHFSGAVAVQY
jgi:hypothetical protein